MDIFDDDNPDGLPHELSSKQARLLAVLAPLIQEYLAEIKSTSTVVRYVKELAIYPIKLDDTVMGFWGLRIREMGLRRLVTIKAFYLRKQYRGRYLNRAADELARKLIDEQKVTDVEIWAHGAVQRWLERRYGIKPVIYVTHCSPKVFDLYRDEPR